MGVKVREKVQGSGIWWVFVNHKGERASMQIGTEKAALSVQGTVEAQLKLGLFEFPGREKIAAAPLPKPTLEAYYQKFERTYLKTACRESTATRYGETFAHMKPKLGHLPLDGITREKVKDFVADLVEKKLAKATIRIITANLCTMFSHAIEDGIVTFNPAAKLTKFYKGAKVVHEIEPLTREEVPIFLRAAKQLDEAKRFKKSPEYSVLYLCAIHAGLRAGELAGLEWPDIDWNGKFFVVRRTYNKNGRIYPTKSGKIRKVDMSDAVIVDLKNLLRTRREKWLADGKNEIPEWVFCGAEGGRVDIQNMKNRHFFKCLEKAKIHRIRFHDLRHTFASLLLQNGESIVYVKEQLGHSSIKVTVDTYGHLIPGANRQAVNRLPLPTDFRTPAAPGIESANEALTASS